MLNGHTKVIMADIIRNRIIRPSSRLESSKSYKINTKQVSIGDILIVNIDHESKPFHKTYKFNGAEVANKDSISFRVNDFETSTEISWSFAQPIENGSNVKPQTIPKPTVVKNDYNSAKPAPPKSISSNLKTSFDPISNTETRILILGTLPGDKSLLQNEYYANSRNYFWKIIATVTNGVLPVTYQDKIKFLHSNYVGLWDVAHKANRKGSLDIAIEDEEPNNLDTFILKHKNLRVIGFNGKKSEALFDKYFTRKTGIKYLLLPSTSSANTSMGFDNICKAWKQIFTA